MRRLRSEAIAAFGSAALAIACGDASAPRPTLTLSPPSIVLLVCQEVTLTATLAPPSLEVVLFRSDNPTVASVSPGGVVRGVRDGAATVRAWLAADSTVRDSTEVSVTSPGPCPMPPGS